MNVIGISAIDTKYYGELKREIREIIARVKDHVYVKLNLKVR